MVALREILVYLEQLLQPNRFQDYCPNGLQVEGHEHIKHIVTGVTASQALLDVAVAQNADAVLVHHGYFWKGEQLEITGIKKRRLQTLLKNNMSLLAYHLPLDAHPVYGNNIQLAEVLDLCVTGSLGDEGPKELIFSGELAHAMEAEAFAQHIQKSLGRSPLHIPGDNNKPIKTIAWCTGGAQGFIEHAVTAGVDAYLTGEISEQTVHIARESGVHFYAAGHHATERYGVKSLGEHLSQQFSISCHFVDIENPA